MTFEQRCREREARRRLRCRHFNGMINDTCNVGVEYISVRDTSTAPYGYPCFSEGSLLCEHKQLYSEEELLAQDAQAKLDSELLSKGLSLCCKAPIDNRCVIPPGSPHAGHGPRFCSKCGKIVFIV